MERMISESSHYLHTPRIEFFNAEVIPHRNKMDTTQPRFLIANERVEICLIRKTSLTKPALEFMFNVKPNLTHYG